MKPNKIQFIKYMRLVIAILIILTLIVYPIIAPYTTLPPEELLMTIWFSFFVFLLGWQYYLEKRNSTQAYFLMLFAIMMLMMSIIGILYA